ncbi:hypothetical protein [Dictyobacter kobayashii]|uniref:Uncharacterized protein n=1 Tax=Dictyobacter kobayashii TaxID=2014872 RepID=A0A402AEE5_9CHLR|nr:hypothetical protein [Dictyobacter kobayashii]GCE17488.1 hypothetical protein KDK_12880 [Dictyobacter kobayashii]
MPKKSAAARSAAQYQRQKGFELVRPEGAENNTSAVADVEPTPKKVKKTPAPVAATPASVVEPAEAVASETTTPVVAPTSASARMAARRLAAQKAQQQRAGNALVTTEHFAYVRRDLITIAILATIMVAAIVILYFVLV